MRITSNMYYKTIQEQTSKSNRKLFDVNRQISSGLKIQYAKDDVRVFTETMRLDNEMVTLGQIKKSTESGYKVSNQTDETMNEFGNSMNRMRTLLVQAANGSNDSTSLDAISDELRGIEKNLKSLANTSINGQFLFSGSAVNVKPISEDGTYNGNDIAMDAFVGSNNKQQYNLTGAELFLGEESLINKEVTSNVISSSLVNTDEPLTSQSPLRELMGDKDNNPNTTNTDYFYLRGTKSNGTAFKEKIALNDTANIDTLLDRIGKAYGNTGSNNVVEVVLDESGQISVRDKLHGSSKLDFHLVGAVDYSGGNGADVTDIDNLDSAETTYPPTGDLYVKEFIKSGYKNADSAASNIEGLLYDRVMFEKDGFYISSNSAQIEKDGNAFASASTKISEVADLSQGNADTLDGSTLKLVGKDVTGNSYDATINFHSTANGGSTFSVGGNTYNIYDMDPNGRKAVDADEMTYQQLLDVINMVTTNELPNSNSVADYDKAINESNFKGDTYLSYDGKITFHDLQGSSADGTKATMSLYDPNSGDFSAGASSSIMTFHANNALSIRDPKTDFFNTIDEIITSVEDHKVYPDATSGHMRNVGIENAISKLDDLQDHVLRMHSKVGAQSNTLNKTLERTQILEVSTMSLRSSVVDTDLAEASLNLTQLMTNYQAMLSTVGKISKLTLVNYL